MLIVNSVIVLAFSVMPIFCQFLTRSAGSFPIGLQDTSHQNLARLKNNSYVYVLYDSAEDCYPYCSLAVSGAGRFFNNQNKKQIRNSKNIVQHKIVCAVPVYLLANKLQSKYYLNCTTLKDMNELVLPKQLVSFGSK